MTRDHVSLTIYNHGTSLVRERRTINLQPGLNTLDITDVTALIDATSVTFQAVENVAVLEQNYLYDLVGGDALLRRYLEQTIEITTEDGNLFTGTLLSAQHGDIILSLTNGQVVYATLDKIRDIRFPALPGGLMTRPTLRWLLQSEVSGTQAVELTYLTGGLNWTADYNLLLAVGNKSFDLNGWVTLDNHSGATFENAQVKLVAGDVKRIQAEAMDNRLMARKINYAAAPEPQVEQREMFEYQLYEIKRPVRVAHNETKQVEFVVGTNVPCKTYYVYDPVGTWYSGYRGVLTDRYYAIGESKITTWLEFSTGTESGLGEDLPAGRIRVYQQDTDGAAVLIGENHINHTPKGETVEFELGAAFDLVGERTQIDFEQRGKTTLQESYEIKLRNRKETETVEIRVIEQLFRWSNWEIVTSSDAYTKRNASSIEFRVSVPPGAEKAITYTVRYSWPT
jgi:hypothetical protein